MYKNTRLCDITKELALVASGAVKADLVVINARLVNVNTSEIQDNLGVAVAYGRIVCVGDVSHCIASKTNVVDADGRYLLPGLMDGHVHIESSMMTVENYAKAVIPHGTTAVFADPHEIANVFGVRGIKFMMEDGANTPLRFYVTMPSCVPAVSAFEDSASVITPKDVEEFMGMTDICGLGEVMNFTGVINADNSLHQELQSTLKHNKTITGHYPMSGDFASLNAYIASGIRCCHETVTKKMAIEKMRLGMFVQIREGSAWNDLKEVIKAVTETNIDSRFATLVSDDTHPDTLIELGHMDYIVKKAMQEGVKPAAAVQMASINVAECFGMSRDLGSISPGKCADMILVSDLTNMIVDSVYIGGAHVAEKGDLLVPVCGIPVPEWIKQSMNIDLLSSNDFIINAPNNIGDKINCKIIEIEEAKVGTKLIYEDLNIINGSIQPLIEKQIIKVSVVERHKNTKTIGKAFVKGFNIMGGAIGSTVSHDAHNLILAGDNDEDIALAANTLINCGGGMVAVKNRKVIALLPLPIAGLMSTEDANDLSLSIKKLDNAWKDLGCNMISPFMTMSLLALSVLPELRITNRGLVDTVKNQFTTLFE